MASRKVIIKYVGPIVVYKIIDLHNYLLMTLHRRILWGLFGHERLKPTILRTSEGNVNDLQGSQCTWKNDNSFSSHGKIMEFYNFAKYHGKLGKTLEKGTVCDICTCDFCLLYRALPIQMYFWEKFWDIWASVVFSDGRVHGASWAGMLLDYKKGDRASANSCPQVASSEVCPHCISQPVLPAWGRLRLGGETRVSHLVRV